MQATELMQMQQEQMTDANAIANIDNEANAFISQAINEAQSTSYGADRNRTSVANNVNLGG